MKQENSSCNPEIPVRIYPSSGWEQAIRLRAKDTAGVKLSND
jgi:hypothetical protein